MHSIASEIRFISFSVVLVLYYEGEKTPHKSALEKLGYIYCESESKKRYKAPLKLTKEGRAVAERLAIKINSVLDFVSDAIQDDERVRFYENLNSVCENLQKFCEKYDDSERTEL